MMTKLAIYILSIMLTGFAFSSTLVIGSDPSSETEKATRSIDPAVIAKEQDGSCCLTRIHKKARGQRSVSFGEVFICDNRKIAPGKTKIRLTLVSEGPPCDEGSPIPHNSVLEASGITNRRADGFAHFEGGFTIKNPAGAILFEGTMEIMDRLGTHHSPLGTEACNQLDHFEGWLTGRGKSHNSNQMLRAMIVAKADLPANGGTSQFTASIDGTIISCR